MGLSFSSWSRKVKRATDASGNAPSASNQKSRGIFEKKSALF